MIRKTSNVPLIIISARNTELDQVFGLEIGADDYLVKPFSVNLLLAKINAIFRRQENVSDFIMMDELGINQNTFKITYKDNTDDLSKVEMRILKKLMLDSPNFFSREDLLEEIWDNKTFVDDNTLSVNISRIKAKLKNIDAPYEIKTKRGVGYTIERGNEN